MRRPRRLNLENEELVRDAARSGKLIAVGDGRYYVNAARVRRRQRLLRFTLVAIVVAGVAELTLQLTAHSG